MARGRKGTAEYVTYTCSLDGCNKTRTQVLSQYIKYNKHYCSNECKHKVGRTIIRPMRDSCKKCKKPMLEIDRYVSSDSEYAVYCKECRLNLRDRNLVIRDMKQLEFITEFDKTEWSSNYERV